MKSKEELNALKEEVEAMVEKLHQLTPEELESVSGGFKVVTDDDDTSTWKQIIDWFFKIAG